MERLKVMRKAVDFDGFWGTVVDLLYYRKAEEAGMRDDSPEGLERVSSNLVNEALGEWLWLHNPPERKLR